MRNILSIKELALIEKELERIYLAGCPDSENEKLNKIHSLLNRSYYELKMHNSGLQTENKKVNFSISSGNC
jgi:hypothetical protein